MTGRWKAWETKNRFPPLPPAPWESRKGSEIPTFPPPGAAPRGSVENQTAVSHSPPRSARRRMRLSRSNTKNRPSNVPPERQEKGREAPVRRCLFGIILRWKRKSISVSFFDWKMLALSRLPPRKSSPTDYCDLVLVLVPGVKSPRNSIFGGRTQDCLIASPCTSRVRVMVFLVQSGILDH